MRLKSVSFGIDHMRKPGWDKYFLNKYQKYIDSIYLSLPDSRYGKLTTSRMPLFILTFKPDYYIDLIDYAKSLNIKINFTLNKNGKIRSKKLTAAEIVDIIKIINIYKPDEICTTEYLIDFLKPEIQNCKFVRTFLETQLNDAILNQKKFDIYILRNHNFFNYLKDKKLSYRLIPNVCCPGCLRIEGSDTECPACKSIFDEICKQPFGLEKYLATHAFTGEDIKNFESLYSDFQVSYKLASRVQDYNSFEYLLDSYINSYNIDDIIKNKYINSSFDYYYFNQNSFLQKSFDNFNLDVFNQEKDQWWNKIQKYKSLN